MLHFRAMKAADCETLLQIDRTLFAAADRYDTAFMHSILSAQHLDAIVAGDAAGNLVAWALLDRGRTPTRIRSLSVHAREQRRGYGERLLRHVIATYPPPLDLLVEQSHLGAVSLYRKLGFEPAGFDADVPARPRLLLDAEPLL